LLGFGRPAPATTFTSDQQQRTNPTTAFNLVDQTRKGDTNEGTEVAATIQQPVDGSDRSIHRCAVLLSCQLFSLAFSEGEEN
jgi:hypothetical protein